MESSFALRKGELKKDFSEEGSLLLHKFIKYSENNITSHRKWAVLEHLLGSGPDFILFALMKSTANLFNSFCVTLPTVKMLLHLTNSENEVQVPHQTTLTSFP